MAAGPDRRGAGSGLDKYARVAPFAPTLAVPLGGRAELIERLGVHYPGISDDDSVTIVVFNVSE